MVGFDVTIMFFFFFFLFLLRIDDGGIEIRVKILSN
jgi:hypothetical protein